MKKTVSLLPLLLLMLSCSTPQNVAYLKDAPRDTAIPVTQHYGSRIFPEDQLYIYVYSQTPESVIPFNEETNRRDYTARTKANTKTSNFKARGHTVGTDGSLLFPLLGTIPTTGMTTEQLGHDIERRLKEGNYVTDPIVTVSLLNFRVTVIGEVKVPRQLHTDGTRLTIFEAIALCGDVTMDAVPSNVVVIRNTDGKEVVDSLDLTSRSILSSPYYYLQQNDIVYVTPTEQKKRTAYRDEDWPRYLSTGIAAITFAYTTYYRVVIQPKRQAARR